MHAVSLLPCVVANRCGTEFYILSALHFCREEMYLKTEDCKWRILGMMLSNSIQNLEDQYPYRVCKTFCRNIYLIYIKC
jgi:hypothetical protein